MIKYVEYLGGVYKVDTTKVHTAINASKILRTHLVFCLPKPAVDKSKPLPWEMPTELGGPKGAEPTRFGTWEQRQRDRFLMFEKRIFSNDFVYEISYYLIQENYTNKIKIS